MLAFLFGGIFWILFIIGPFFIFRKKKKSPRGYIKHLLYLTGMYTFKGSPSAFESKFYE